VFEGHEFAGHTRQREPVGGAQGQRIDGGQQLNVLGRVVW
jgi:hypothetical protein